MGRPCALMLVLPLLTNALQADPSYEPYATLGDTTTFFHQGNVLALAFFPDGKHIVSSTDRGQIIVWDASTGVSEATHKPTFRTESLAVTPDGRQVVAGTSNGSAVLLEWPGWTVGRTVSSPGSGSVVVSQNGSRAIAQNKDKLDFFDLATGKVDSEAHKHPQGLFSLRLAISPDGEFAASADGSGLVRLWKTTARKNVASAKVAGDGNYIHVTFSGDGKQIVVHSNAIAATAFDVPKLAQPVTWDGYRHIHEVANHTVVVAIMTEAIVVLDPKTRKEVSRFDRPGPEIFGPLAIAPEMKRVAIVVDYQSIKILGLPDLKETVPVLGPGGRVFDVDLSRKGDRIAATSVDGYVHVWDLGDRKLQKTIDGRFAFPSAHLSAAVGVRWASDGVSVDGLAPFGFARWNATTGAKGVETSPPQGGTFRAFVPDGESTLVIASGPTLQRLLPANGNRLVATVTAKCEPNDNPAFTADGSKFAIRIDDTAIVVVDAKNGQTIRKVGLKTKRTDRVLISPDADHLVTVGDEISVVQCKDSQTVRKIELKGISRSPGGAAQGYSLSPDGRLLALSFEKYEVYLWRLSDGKLLQTLTGPNSIVQKVRFSPDGKWLFAAGWDRAVHVWTRGK